MGSGTLVMARLLLSTGVGWKSLSRYSNHVTMHQYIDQGSGRPVRGAVAPRPPMYTHAKVSYCYVERGAILRRTIRDHTHIIGSVTPFSHRLISPLSLDR